MDNVIEMDIAQLCRSCMKELSMWEFENIDDRTQEMFCYCTNIKLSDDEKLPKKFCNDCISKLEASYSYITEAQKTDVTLRNIISRSVTSIIIEPENYYRSYDEHYSQNVRISHNSESNFSDQVLTDDIDNESNKPSVYKVCKTDENTTAINTKEDEIHLEQSEASAHATSKDETEKNVCPVCRKSFVSKTWFTKHMAKEHTGEKYTCNHCQKTFAKQSQLRCHLTSHSEERKFPCSVCGKRFKCNKQLTVHARAHADARPYACDKCTMRFKKRSILKCHMKVHENDKQFLCSFCGWSFAQAGNLEVHMRRHTGDKPYACGSCAFRAAAASNLRRHQRAHQKPRTHSHVCNTCGKGFCDASSLGRHQRTHTGERPYRCAWCPRAFADSWKRKLHLMRAHRLALHLLPRLSRDGQLLEPLPHPAT